MLSVAKCVPPLGLSLVTVTTAAAGLATVNPSIALIAVKILSAVTLFEVLGLKKCILPEEEEGAPLPAVSDCRVNKLPSASENFICVPAAILA